MMMMSAEEKESSQKFFTPPFRLFLFPPFPPPPPPPPPGYLPTFAKRSGNRQSPQKQRQTKQLFLDNWRILYIRRLSRLHFLHTPPPSPSLRKPRGIGGMGGCPGGGGGGWRKSLGFVYVNHRLLPRPISPIPNENLREMILYVHRRRRRRRRRRRSTHPLLSKVFQKALSTKSFQGCCSMLSRV